MALNLVTNPNTPPTANPGDWNNFVDREDTSNVGNGTAIDTITLTNWDATTNRPLIGQGSRIEVGGSLYLADSDTALVDDGGLSDGLVHIKLVPSGGTVIPTLTSDAIPAWSKTKAGWYDSDDKFLPFEMTRSGAVTKVYSNKVRFPYQNKTYNFSSVGDLDLDGAVTAGGSGTFGGGGSFGGNMAISGALSGVTTLDMSGALSPGNAVSGSITLGASSNQVLARGVYIFSGSNTALAWSVSVDIFANGSWRNIATHNDGAGGWFFPGAFVFSDGTNVRVSTGSGGGFIFNYIKF